MMSLKSWLAGIITYSLVFLLMPFLLIKANLFLGFFILPYKITKLLGGLLIGLGIVDVVYCSQLFKIFGKGTPAPVDPPQQLVSAGLYKYSRNPIYLGYFAVILGQFLLLGHFLLLIYFLLSLIVVNIYIIFFEEKTLTQRFGKKYQEYCQTIPRW